MLKSKSKNFYINMYIYLSFSNAESTELLQVQIPQGIFLIIAFLTLIDHGNSNWQFIFHLFFLLLLLITGRPQLSLLFLWPLGLLFIEQNLQILHVDQFDPIFIHGCLDGTLLQRKKALRLSKQHVFQGGQLTISQEGLLLIHLEDIYPSSNGLLGISEEVKHRDFLLFIWHFMHFLYPKVTQSQSLHHQPYIILINHTRNPSKIFLHRLKLRFVVNSLQNRCVPATPIHIYDAEPPFKDSYPLAGDKIGISFRFLYTEIRKIFGKVVLWLIGMYGYGVCWCVEDLSPWMISFHDALATVEGVPLLFLDEVVISHVLVGWIADESAQLLLDVLIGEVYLD